MKAILLDYDGVIVDSLDQVIERWNETAKVFGNGMTVTKELARSTSTASWRIFYSNTLGVPEEQLDVASQLFREMANKQGPPPLFAGMVEVIAALSQTYAVYVLSSNHSDVIRNNLDSHRLTPYIKDIAGDKEVGGLHKTDPRFILNPLEKWNIDPENVVYIGDTADEIIGGKAAGVGTICCTWGFQSEALVIAQKPDEIVRAPQEIPAAVQKIFAKKV